MDFTQKRCKLEWLLFALSLVPLVLLVPQISNLVTGCTASPQSECCALQYRVISIGMVTSLSLLLLSGLAHLLYRLKNQKFTPSIDNLIHVISLLIFSIVIGINHLKFRFDVDDNFYREWFSQNPFIDLLTHLYNHTTPCILIHTFVAAFVNLPPFVWRLFDALVMVLLVELALRIFVPKDKLRYSPLFIGFSVLIPKEAFCDTGWCAVTLNYLWPCTASFCIYFLYKRILDGKAISLFSCIFSIPITLFACNSIQSAVLFSAITIVLIGWRRYTAKSWKEIEIFLWQELFIAFLSLLFILSCPGNASRAAGEITQWFTNFNDYSTWQKLHMGFINFCTFFWSTGEWNIMVNHFPFVTLPLSIILSYRMLKEHKNPLLVISALFIVVFSVLPYLNFILTRFTNYAPTFFSFLEKREIYAGDIHLAPILVPTFCYLFLLECIIIGIHDAFRGSWYGAVILLVFIAGICTSMMLSFSPTLYASGSRVMFFQAVSILCVTIALFVKCIDDKVLPDRTFIIICLALALFIPTANKMKRIPAKEKPVSSIISTPNHE